ncbi:uncharacterized protein EI90DRAFT_268095 [Cantharellus anzutake]|uniref:uncharacterized protein n=1 Tax=Cantharellus anzutake TaxID=1750568 RepID=UPI001903CB88|nr:uncharacterized protein EI90DRAFT_268095 [Cantharellus anzutake]KAF8335873.1 hypothetical protein EI90DRAFT_268095 [Cantharellus anzutake]
MARLFGVPGVVFIVLATILGVLVTISLPTVDNFDVVRLRTAGAKGTLITTASQSVRWGIWGFCEQSVGSSDFNCHKTGLAYSVMFRSISGGGTQTVGGSYTRGLVFHPIVLAFCIITLGLSFSKHLVVSLVASLLSFFTCILAILALAIDIVLYLRVRSRANNLSNVRSNTDFGPAFWMTVAQLIFLLLSGCAILLARRQERIERDGPNTSYPLLEKNTWWRRIAQM